MYTQTGEVKVNVPLFPLNTASVTFGAGIQTSGL